MLETLALDTALKKKDYKKRIKPLDTHLGEVQRELKTKGIPVLIVFEGWDTSGKGTAIGRLVQAFDPRGFDVYHVNPVSEQELYFPPMHRFWLRLPARGEIAVFNHSWYRQVLDEAVDKRLAQPELASAYERMRVFERQLTDDGAVIIKFFLHISKEEQAKRFKDLAKDPAFSWKVGDAERQRHNQYDLYVEYIEAMLRETSMPHAPWTVLPSTDKHYLTVKVAETVLDALNRALSPAKKVSLQIPATETSQQTSPLEAADLSLSVDKATYNETLPRLQSELYRLQHLCYVARTPVVLVFEGWDAAGKGGAIRRLTWELDPRGYAVIPFGAPEGEEAHKHYLWRFWRALQKSGHISIYDRSWYGRVLVERVEGYATSGEWTRAYREINEFEAELLDFGVVLCKFWMHISKEEQLRRFEARKNTPEKQWKITEEDWRNREKWDVYREAVSDMLVNTSTPAAPWTLVEGNAKRYARLKVLSVVRACISKAVEGPKPS